MGGKGVQLYSCAHVGLELLVVTDGSTAAVHLKPEVFVTEVCVLPAVSHCSQQCSPTTDRHSCLVSVSVSVYSCLTFDDALQQLCALLSIMILLYTRNEHTHIYTYSASV